MRSWLDGLLLPHGVCGRPGCTERYEPLWVDGTGVVYVRVFGLSGEDVPANRESHGIAKRRELTWCDLNKHEEVALVANLFLEQTVVRQIEPGASVGIRDRLDELVGQRAVSGIDELAIGRASANLAARDVLEGLDRIQNMPNVLEGDAVMISAKGKTS